jgi:tetratricopeptide (TPR) repeat protein
MELSSRYQTLSHVNNLGTLYLDNGDFPSALDCFRFALGQLRNKCAVVSPQAKQSYNMNGPTTTTERDVAFFPTSTHPQQITLSPLVHARGIRMPKTRTSFLPQDPMEDWNIYSSIVVFNLSLVYHLQGLASIAQKFYRHSLRLLDTTIREYEQSQTSNGDTTIDFLSLALLNNLAQVSIELCVFQEAGSIVKKLVRVACALQSADYGNAQVAIFMHQQRNTFLLNAIMIHAGPRIAAPAA